MKWKKAVYGGIPDLVWGRGCVANGRGLTAGLLLFLVAFVVLIMRCAVLGGLPDGIRFCHS